MAEKKDQQSKEDWKIDDLAEKVVPDPSHPDVKRLTGFILGASDKAGYWRLYLSVDMNHYLEFKKEETRHAEQIRKGRTVVWLAPTARIIETKTQSAPIDFLRGEIRRGFLRGFNGVVNPTVFAEDCPGSGCAHCSVACSTLPDPGADSIGYTCGC